MSSSEVIKILEHSKPRRERAEADAALRTFLAKKLREHHLSRPRIAEKLTELLGEPVSVARLYSYTAATKTSARLPAYFLQALCEVLDSDELVLFVARPRFQKQVQLAEQLRGMRRICSELLAESKAKHRRHQPPSKPMNGEAPHEKKDRSGSSCAQ